MKPEQIERTIRDYIPQIIHMSIASVKDNRPWVCEVHFSFDDELNLYFASSTTTRHAQEFMENPRIAGNIVTQHHKDQKVRCVDFEGTVEALDAEAAEQTAYPAYVARYGVSEGLLNQIRRDGEVRFFKITVENYYLFDSYGDERGKHALAWKGGETA